MKPFLAVILFISIWAYPQKSGIVTYRGFYTATQLTEEFKKKDPSAYRDQAEYEEIARTLRFEMHFSNNESFFSMVEGLPADSYDETNVSIAQSKFYGLDSFYNNLATDESLELANIMDRIVLIEKKISETGWQLTDETKMIDGYKCYKATTEYKYHWNGKDRSWPVTAWYAPSIPIDLGPLRYAGLPGLILELSEGYCSWVVERIDLSPKKKIKVARPKSGEAMTQEELDSQTDKMKKDIMGN
ncbi:GLPGLI family protein [Flavobacterium sp. MFBS3-15]|uniref:GLPGLI family protein n=1 Tax=Flavobacterium sp. MFBS3-15 TaxID=2989816 RepID=UPI002235B034|nr:GLPGLI family protein [Flavobacterium sp. MFBS3-15]MCW4469263.1 GLPGLI family protein [Flavobacterium sp. MFBS3-15]